MKFLCIALTILALASPSQGQYCPTYSRPVYAPAAAVYEYPTVVQATPTVSVAVPYQQQQVVTTPVHASYPSVLVPAFSFQYLPALQGQAVAVQPGQQVVNGQAVNGQAQQVQQQQIQQQLANGTNGNGMGQQPAEQQNQDGPPAVPGTVQTPQAQTQAAPVLNGNGNGNGNGKSSDAAAIAILQTKCVSCHSGNNAGQAGKGGVTLFDGNRKFASNIDFLTIHYVTKSRRMPPGADKNSSLALNDQDQKTILNRMLENEK